MATGNKIELAYTSQDVKAQECAMINKLGTDINSFDEGDIKNPNKIPEESKPTQFWGRRLELEKSIFNISRILVNEIVVKVENATFLHLLIYHIGIGYSSPIIPVCSTMCCRQHHRRLFWLYSLLSNHSGSKIFDGNCFIWRETIFYPILSVIPIKQHKWPSFQYIILIRVVIVYIRSEIIQNILHNLSQISSPQSMF